MKRRIDHQTTFRVRSVILVLCLIVSSQVIYPVQPKDPADEAIIDKALAPFAGRTIDGIFDYLDRIRPIPVKESDREFLLRDMTLVTGEAAVRDPIQIQKLKRRVRGALALHRRINVIDFYIFRYPYPAVMNKPGVFIAITTTLQQVIGDDDAALVGIVSHELAHEYIAVEMLAAQQKRDLARQRELELFCDGVAVATLIALGLDTNAYARVLERVVNFSTESLLLNNGERGMPSLFLRERLINGLILRLKASAPQH